MELRDYQIELASRANNIIRSLGICYISAQVRTGKTLIALETAKLLNAKNVLFLTKKIAIKGILSDYTNMGYKFTLTVVNDEQLHKLEQGYDFVIHDEHHRFGAFPKPSGRSKAYRNLFYYTPQLWLSGTPTPETFSQIYHQFWCSHKSPFIEKTFYKWAQNYINIKKILINGNQHNDYSNARIDLIEPILEPYFIKFSQQDAGFASEVKETVLFCDMKPQTYELINRLKRDLVINGNREVILADTPVKMLTKIHQLCSGTIKFESGYSIILDYSKARFIQERFEGIKIGIFYKFKEELNLLKVVFGDNLTTDIDEFNATDKNIALQIISGREGISLKEAKYLVYYNIDFSATSYWQSRDRLTTIDRQSNEVFYIFANKGIERQIYKAVQQKKNFTTKYYDRSTIAG